MKIALITGASRGIGREVAFKLARQGYHTIINYLSNREQACRTMDMIIKEGGSAELLAFDVADVESVKDAILSWKEKNQGQYIQVVVNNAGIRRDGLMMWMDPSDWRAVLSISLDGFYNVTHLLLEDMLIKRAGRVINIVSLSGLKGMAGQTNYSAAKGGVIAATKALALEVAKKGVTVNAVAPGFVRTEMTSDLNEAELKKMVPLGRFAEASEVAELVGFLASEQAAYITGEVISINGGLYT